MALAALALAALALPAAAQTVYQQDFESGSAGISGGGFSTDTRGYGALGFGSQMWRNWDGGTDTATVVSFTLAAASSQVQLQLDLAVIDSWDGAAALNAGCCADDTFKVRVNGNEVFSTEFNNVWGFVPFFPGPDSQSFPRDGRMLAAPVADLAGEWIGSSGYDSAYRLSIALGALGAGTHQVEFYATGSGWQAGTDESFAIDNLRISAVPEPQAGWLLAAGLAGLGLVARRRRAG